MLEIFFPQRIFDKISINFMAENEIKELEKNFENLEIKDFKTNILSGLSLKIPKYDEDLIIFANGKFWKKYFSDNDFTKNHIFSFWKPFYKDQNFFKDLENIDKDIFQIKSELESNTLLTNSKKIEMKEKIEYIFFLLSWVYFNIFTLLEKTNQNISELQNLDSKAEYEATAELIIESSKTKKVELESALQSLENRISLFYQIILQFFWI